MRISAAATGLSQGMRRRNLSGMVFKVPTSLASRRSLLFAAMLCPILFMALPHPVEAETAPSTIDALFVSDIHFEPFWDPAKVAKLAAAPLTGWTKILAAPTSPNRQQAFDSLQTTCHTRGTDTEFPLLRSSMTAIRSHASGAKFITLSGDLMAHGFDCKFRTLLPHASDADYRAFTVKTIRFVLAQLQASAPGVPIYTALGNNDSNCGDYKIDANSAFLREVGQAVTEHIPAKERAAAAASFAEDGNYSVTLPPPISNTRLVVLDDVFFSPKHTACSGKPDTAAQNAQYAWLITQLEEAKQAHQNVWVMAHIPPGVDAYATLAHLTGPCGRAPSMLLSSDRLAQILEGSAASIKLVLFGHTHEDEIKLLDSGDTRAPEDHATANAIPAKLVASISPINGNLPSFTVAQIDLATATLINYQVFAGSNKVPWHQQYDYRGAYSEAAFNADRVKDLVQKFAADHDWRTPPSRNYIHNFSIGNPVPLLSLVWPGYVCTMSHQTAERFTQCACSQQPHAQH